ncbi:MAG TPA: ATP-dependent helicase [Candidatus Bipolaricaulota bacterium]|nr:ATP-dependent helicase [Candidatus Bipolaricaulota bacterium]
MIDFKKELNEEQYKVVSEADGPALVLAGAGSGKTRTLVYRVAYLIEKGVSPENILLVTFTNKAANEMMERIKKLLGFEPKKFWAGTFHHIGNVILRQYAAKLGYQSNFNILDQDDSVTLLKSVYEDFGIKTKGHDFPKADLVHSIISFAFNTRKPVLEVAEEIYGYPDFVSHKIDDVAASYEEKKKSANLMDFDDLLTKWLDLLKKFPETKTKLSERFHYILVDEYQDTNHIQAEIIYELASVHQNVLVVGDDSQSIYSFRAADIKNILNFPKRFENAKIYKLETNYRSTPQILDLANASIEKNKDQFRKNLNTHKPDGILPILIPARDVYQQASMVVNRILEIKDKGRALREAAVLFRSTFQSAELQLEMSKRNIPYVVRGGLRYFEQAHIKDIVSYLKIIQNFRDEISWKRLLKMREGIGVKNADAIWKKIQKFESLNEVLATKIQVGSRASASWNDLNNILRKMFEIKENNRGIADMIKCVLDLDYKEYARNVFENYRDRLDDIRQLMNFVVTYEKLEDLLTDVMLSESYRRNDAEARDEVVLSTIHQAKGLEWPYVIIIGLCDGAFPHHKSMEDRAQLEEERRLFYVAVTRAKEELSMIYPIRTISYEYGEMINQPSMFIKELEPSLYVTVGGDDYFNAYLDNDSQDRTIYYD